MPVVNRLARFEVKIGAPRFAISISFAGVSSVTLRAREVSKVFFDELAMPAFAMHKAHIDAAMRSAGRGTVGAKMFASRVRRRKRAFAIAPDLACQSHPGRRGSFSARGGIIDRHFAVCSSLWIFH